MESSSPYHDRFFVYDAPTYYGQLADDQEGTSVHCWAPSSRHGAWLPPDGAVFGFVAEGGAFIDRGRPDLLRVVAGDWFTTVRGFAATVEAGSRVVAFQRQGHVGVEAFGSLDPAHRGDLWYIDGCRDSILVAPRVRGMPVLNFLHVPAGVHQTMHTHPSTRAGVILEARRAWCETTTNHYDLVAGSVFFLPKNGRHKFRTADGDGMLRLIAFHPDSADGPTDDDHAMLNRTMVEGVSARRAG
jgi:hypothetical protein